MRAGPDHLPFVMEYNFKLTSSLATLHKNHVRNIKLLRLEASAFEKENQGYKLEGIVTRQELSTVRSVINLYILYIIFIKPIFDFILYLSLYFPIHCTL